MEWLLCVAITIIAGACSVFIDNYVSDYYFKGRGTNAQKNFYILPFIIVGLICLCITGVNFEIPFHIYLILFASGLICAASGLFYFKALETSDSTEFSIFSQLSPIFYLILGWLFLNQNINAHQFIAFLIIISAPILIILTTKKRSRQPKLKACFYTLLYVIVDAISVLIFVKFNGTQGINFITGMGVMLIGSGIGNGIILLANPKWRKRYRFVVKSSHHKVYYSLFGGLVANVTFTFANNIALILAPSVAIVTAIIYSALPIFVFFFGLLFTLLWPKFGREKMNRKTILIHLIATILVVIGICLIQLS